MNNNDDKLLREKIASVSPLQGGIVFGKEEAWEKLQAKLDKKPARLISLLPLLAIAAMLVMVICISLYYFHGQSRNDQKDYVQHTNDLQPNNTPQMVGQPAPATPAAETTTVYTANAPETSLQRAIHPETPKLSSVPLSPAAIPLIAQSEGVILPVAGPQTTATLRPKMKILHINELDKPQTEEAATTTDVAANGPSLVNKMRVLHINELNREESVQQFAPHENKVSIGSFTLLRQPSPNRSTAGHSNDPYARSLLKINLNAQN